MTKPTWTSLTPIACLALVACAAAISSTPVAPPIYPWDGFGRVGCYAGPGLARMYEGDPAPGPSAADAGPWLVLDSMTATELRRAGHEGPIDPSDLRPGSLVERADSLLRTGGHWYRVPRDSIIFEEWGVFPPVDWRLLPEAEGLRGEGVLEHDMIIRGPDGVERRHVSRWAIEVVRVPCSVVPVIDREWPPGRQSSGAGDVVLLR